MMTMVFVMMAMVMMIIEDGEDVVEYDGVFW